MATKTTSKKYRIDLTDLAKGLLLAVLSAVVTELYQFTSTGQLPTKENLQTTALVACAAGLSYLLKNFFTDSQTIVKSVVLFAFMSLALSGCSFVKDVQNHASIKVTKVPTHPNDAIAITASFWGTADLIHQYAPGNTKAGKFLKESTKHCRVQLVSVPKDANDTISIRLTCDSTLHTVQGWIPKK